MVAAKAEQLAERRAETGLQAVRAAVAQDPVRFDAALARLAKAGPDSCEGVGTRWVTSGSGESLKLVA
jgi:hypothetical protein